MASIAGRDSRIVTNTTPIATNWQSNMTDKELADLALQISWLITHWLSLWLDHEKNKNQ
jgi:hypothetical protein